MKWISRNDPPIYIWKRDLWYNQKDKLTYHCDLEKKEWHNDKYSFPFTKKTRIMSK